MQIVPHGVICLLHLLSPIYFVKMIIFQKQRFLVLLHCQNVQCTLFILCIQRKGLIRTVRPSLTCPSPIFFASAMCATKEPPHSSQTHLILALHSCEHPEYLLPPIFFPSAYLVEWSFVPLSNVAC